MARRSIRLAMMVAGLLVATAAFADYEQDIVRQLQGMGFTQVEVTRTLLGRVRITAAGADGTREIILNPNTGEILRDLWLRSDGRAQDRALLDGPAREEGAARRSGNSGGNGSPGRGDDEGVSGKPRGSGTSGSTSGSDSGSGNSGNSGSGSSGKSGGGSDDSGGKRGGDDGDDE